MIFGTLRSSRLGPFQETRCSTGITCLTTELTNADQTEHIGEAGITAAFESCVDSSTLPKFVKVSDNLSTGPTAVFNALEDIFEANGWGIDAQRVIPAHVNESEGGNISKMSEWPLVDDARGQAIFWVGVNELSEWIHQRTQHQRISFS